MRQLTQSNDAEAIYTEAARHEAIGGLDKAEALYRQFAQLAPQDPRGPNKLGVCKALQGNLDEAEQLFAAALSLNPQFAPALTNLGNILLERNDVDGAVAKYEQALQFDPDYSSAHNNLAAALKRMGKLQPAVQHLKQAQRLARRQDRDSARSQMPGGCGFSGTTALLLASLGVLSLGTFWR